MRKEIRNVTKELIEHLEELEFMMLWYGKEKHISENSQIDILRKEIEWFFNNMGFFTFITILKK